MAYDDILGSKKDNDITEASTEEIIEAMEYNIKKKQELINDLLKKITDLEIEIERYQNNETVSI